MSERTGSVRELAWEQVDVFAEAPLEGNQLAIFTDGRGLTTEQMQMLARETNLSETTFVIPRDEATERERGVQVRIFTTQEELKFAGHPTLGTASWLYWNHTFLRGQETITLDLPVGQIPVRFTQPVAGERGVFGEMRQRDPEFGRVYAREAVAEALGLTVEDLHAELEPQTASTGMPFCIVPLESVEAVGRLALNLRVAQPFLAASDAKFFYVVAPVQKGGGNVENGGADWHARMQFYNGEDPATGSAAGCCISYLVRHGAVEPGKNIFVEQGVEMLRPSRLRLRGEIRDGKVCEIHVAGRTIPVAKGRFFLPI
ncbi:PhzF family phenazine biosynthesis protein [Terriglobus tenax]|uniref:PhzF family phenazine biosynthesis protein n=1 Tax=Terriglobus tenax TaxID=1111115 RepID=UPI0021E0BF95|nr:PhzF family phenazine biosynthesis protein [Terriglobus tenax]